MTEADTLPATSEQLGPPERLHPLYLLTGLSGTVKGAWGLLAGGVLFASQDRWLLVAVMGIAFVILSVGSLFIRWLKFEYRVGAHELRIESGWLSRTSRSIPFDRVTDVDLEQGPLQRLLDLARVKLETGASAGGKEEEGVLHTISLARAEALREHVRARKGRVLVQPTAAGFAAEGPPLFAMDSRRVVTAGIFNFSLAVIAGLFGVTQTMGDALGFDPFKRQFWLDLLARSEPLQSLVMAHQMVAIIGGSLLLILLGIGTGLTRTLLREHGFRLDRTEAGLRRRRGLLTLTDVTIPARRAQAAILSNGPVRRRFGWWVLKLQSLAQDGGKGDHVVAPLADEAEAAAILTSLGWPIAPGRHGWWGVNRAYVTSFIGILAPASFLTIAAFPWVGPVALLWLLGAGFAIGIRWLDWKRARYALGEGTLFVERGWWRHRRNIIPVAKIQSVDLAQSWWGRKFGICTLRLGVAGGSGFADHQVPALTPRDAEALRADLLA